MSTITVQLPQALAESLRRETLPPDKAIIKALEEWLEKRRQELKRPKSWNRNGCWRPYEARGYGTHRRISGLLWRG